MSYRKVIIWANEETMVAIGGFMREFDGVVTLLVRRAGTDDESWPPVEPFTMRSLIEILSGEFVRGLASRDEIVGMVSLASWDPVLHIFMASGDRSRTLVIRAARAMRDERPWDAFCAILVEGEGTELLFRPLDSFKMNAIIARQDQDERETHRAAEDACDEIIDSASTIQPGETWVEDLEVLFDDELPSEGELEE